MPLNLEIVADNQLAEYLKENSGLKISLTKPDATASSQALECGLETLAAVVTIAAGTATLAEVSLRLTKTIKDWLRDRGLKSTPLILRGDADDTALNLTHETEAVEVEKSIATVSS